MANTSGNHLSKEMLELIKSIGDSRSKQEEDKIILKELDTLKVKIKESNINNKKMKEYLMRAIYIEMLGHEAPFSHFQAVNLTQDKNLMNKRVGYLASNLLLNENSECLIMLVSTLQKDMLSLHWIEVCMALITVVKFATSSIIVQAVIEQVYKLLDNKSEQVRKKAVCCLHRFYQVNPSNVPDVNDKMRKMLCDYDPSVMASTLNFFHDVVQKDSQSYKDLVSSFVVILKQVIEHKLPRDYDYHRLPAPWIQMKILQILSVLGKDDQSASEGMYEMLSQVLRRADDTGINIGYAIVYQCLRTICVIYPNPHLLEQAATTISRFLSSDSPNLRCTGINGLSLIIQINHDYVANHQQVIVDCLEENDETLKKNTFELLYKMTDTNNVEVIVEKMISYLKTTEVEGSGRKNILFKITELAELYAPDKRWFIRIMNQLFVNFGNLITDEILSKLIKIINEWADETDEEEFKEFTILNYTEIVNTVSNLPDHLVQLIAYIFGEYSLTLSNGNDDEIESNIKLLEFLLEKQYDQDKTKVMILTAMLKIHLNLEFKGYEFITGIMEFFSSSKNVEIQQKANEYLRMKKFNLFKAKEFVSNSSTRDLIIDPKLTFLDSFVRKKIEEGGRRYNRSIYKTGEVREEKTLRLKEYPEMMINKQGIKNISAITGTEVKNVSNTNNTSGTTKNKESKTLWSEKGFIPDLQQQDIKTPKQGQSVFSNNPNTTSVTNQTQNKDKDSKDRDNSNLINLGNKDSRFVSVQGGNTKSTNKDKDSKDNKFIMGKSKPEVKVDPKKAEKDELKNKLFGPKTGGTTTSTAKPVFDKSKVQGTMNKFSQNNQSSNNNPKTNNVIANTKVTKEEETRNDNINNNNITGDLLGLGSSDNTNNNGNNNTNNNTNKQASELYDIFGLGSNTTSTQETEVKINKNTIIDDIFSVGNMGNNITTTKESNNNTSTDLFGIFGSQPSSNNFQQGQQGLFKPFIIDTESFGQMWMDCPNDEFSIAIQGSKINSPEKYFEVIRDKNMHPIEIINDEAIGACYFNNEVLLVHSTITSSELSILYKSASLDIMKAVKPHLEAIFKK